MLKFYFPIFFVDLLSFLLKCYYYVSSTWICWYQNKQRGRPPKIPWNVFKIPHKYYCSKCLTVIMP